MEQENEKYGYVSKIQFAISIIFLLIITMMLFICSYLLLNSKINQMHPLKISNESPTFNEIKNEEKNELYLIKEYNGKLAVYKNNDFQYELDIFVFTLPEEDKIKALRPLVPSGSGWRPES